MSKAYLSLVLHAHLPFVRHPEYDRFLEELWLFEAISETYLPLLRVFERLEMDGVPFKVTLSVSPTLAAMLDDELLQERYLQHLELMQELADKEVRRTAKNPDFLVNAQMYRDFFAENYRDYVEKYGKRILKGFQFFQKRGRLELITTSASHAYLPLYESYPEALKAQVQLAVQSHYRNFGGPPKGFWLPELGFTPGLEDYLKDAGLEYFFVATHGILFADERPKNGVYGPLLCPNGLAAFGRDLASANAVWSSEEGYPGDFIYRDFYRDIGFDLPLDYIRPYIHEDDLRIYTGFKYYAITGRTDEKIPYKPELALKKTQEHAENFIYNRRKQVKHLEKIMDRPPLFTCPYNAELFGHWWFEGPSWIEALFRGLQNTAEIEAIFPSEYLAAHRENQVCVPAFSSWGNKGYSEVWLNGDNDWIYRHTHGAVERMIELVERYPNEKGLKERALNQAAREVLLSQASDWPFIMHTGTAVGYAEQRLKEHLNNFTRIYDALSSGAVGTEWLTRLERKNNLFPDMDYRIFRGQGEVSGP